MIRWTEEVQAEPVTKTFVLRVVEIGHGEKGRPAEVEDLARIVASLPPADRAAVVGTELVGGELPEATQQGIAELNEERVRAWESVEAVAKALGCFPSKVTILMTLKDLAAAHVREEEGLRARTETAERERDEAQGKLRDANAMIARAENALYGTGATRGDIETRAKHTKQAYAESVSECAAHEETIDRLRSDLERTAKERDEARMRADLLQLQRDDGSAKLREWQAVVEAAKLAREQRDTDLSHYTTRDNRPGDYVYREFGADTRVRLTKADLDVYRAVDALTADAGPAAEPKPPPDPEPLRVGLAHLEKLYANRNIDRRECEEALVTAFPLMVAEIRAARSKPPPPPDPNEREELGRVVYAALYPGASWEGCPIPNRDLFIRAASAVASRVREKDGRGR